MSERTAQEWADYITAAIEGAKSDGYFIDLDMNTCGSGCCSCSVDDVTIEVVSAWQPGRRLDRASLEW